MKRILCLLMTAALPFASAFADAPKSKNAKVTLACDEKPAKLLAVFVVDTNETTLTTPFAH